MSRVIRIVLQHRSAGEIIISQLGVTKPNGAVCRVGRVMRGAGWLRDAWPSGSVIHHSYNDPAVCSVVTGRFYQAVSVRLDRSIESAGIGRMSAVASASWFGGMV